MAAERRGNSVWGLCGAWTGFWLVGTAAGSLPPSAAGRHLSANSQ
ncbi:unnamed protein product [Spirodela intermedia]|uniref:Uncharacterized protein n=1 Tax=Spirodela intermedia TaxID=51605 RepID=A0ABN7E9A0_SPIIN|nr:unnamed protein product [Spirodela intermedia]